MRGKLAIFEDKATTELVNHSNYLDSLHNSDSLRKWDFNCTQWHYVHCDIKDNQEVLRGASLKKTSSEKISKKYI